jgi:hypothetical protein
MLDFRSKLALTNKLLKMYYFELDTTPQSEANFRELLEVRIAKILKQRNNLINGKH